MRTWRPSSRLQAALEELGDCCAEPTAVRVSRMGTATTMRARNMGDPLGQECSAEMRGGEEGLGSDFWGEGLKRFIGSGFYCGSAGLRQDGAGRGRMSPHELISSSEPRLLLVFGD